MNRNAIKVIETLKFEMNPCGWSLEVWVHLWTKGEKRLKESHRGVISSKR